MTLPAPRPEPPAASTTLGPQAAVPSVADRVAQEFGDFHALAVMQGTKIELAQRFLKDVFGLDWNNLVVQGAALELAAARREEAMLHHAIEQAIAGKQAGAGDYTLAFVNALKDGSLDLMRNRLKEVRGQALRAEDALWAYRRLVHAKQGTITPLPGPGPSRPVRRFQAPQRAPLPPRPQQATVAGWKPPVQPAPPPGSP